jgi:hypothetical protein
MVESVAGKRCRPHQAMNVSISSSSIRMGLLVREPRRRGLRPARVIITTTTRRVIVSSPGWLNSGRLIARELVTLKLVCDRGGVDPNFLGQPESHRRLVFFFHFFIRRRCRRADRAPPECSCSSRRPGCPWLTQSAGPVGHLPTATSSAGPCLLLVVAVFGVACRRPRAAAAPRAEPVHPWQPAPRADFERRLASPAPPGTALRRSREGRLA